MSKIMKIFTFLAVVLLCLLMTNSEDREIKFDNAIVAVGFPYYKILMALGSCKDTLLFRDQKAWSKVRLNRVIDIFYKSVNEEMVVSRVEVEVVLNDTDCFMVTRTGIGRIEFAGTLFIPTRAAIVLYQLYIYTCSKPLHKDRMKTKTKLTYTVNKTSDDNVFYEPATFMDPDSREAVDG